MAPATNVLDHIAHLSSPGKLSEAVNHWERLGFKVIPEGQHGDSLTSNALVALVDGVYIELIAFEKPASEYPPDNPRAKHWWANNEPGWVDWACLVLENNVDKIIASREKEARSGVRYEEWKTGGRKRASDGQELKWRVTFPELKDGRGTIPFFCQDLTPRDLRVPAADIGTHPNTALGISHLHISVPTTKVDEVKAQLSVVLGTQPGKSGEWELALPPETTGSSQPIPAPRLKLVTSNSSSIHIEEVGFYVKRVGEEVHTPRGFGKVVFVEM